MHFAVSALRLYYYSCTMQSLTNSPEVHSDIDCGYKAFCVTHNPAKYHEPLKGYPLERCTYDSVATSTYLSAVSGQPIVLYYLLQAPLLIRSFLVEPNPYTFSGATFRTAELAGPGST